MLKDYNLYEDILVYLYRLSCTPVCLAPGDHLGSPHSFSPLTLTSHMTDDFLRPTVRPLRRWLAGWDSNSYVEVSHEGAVLLRDYLGKYGVLLGQ